MAKRILDGQLVRRRPTGESDAPALGALDIERFPAPREHADLLHLIDFAWIEQTIDAGRCVAICVSQTHEDIEALRDSLTSRIGFDLLMRAEEPGTLWVARPRALEP